MNLSLPSVLKQYHQLTGRRVLLGGAALVGCVFVGFAPIRSGWAASLMKSTSDKPIVFTNLRLFDGSGSAPREGLKLLVVGNKIEAILEQDAATTEQAYSIDGGGKYIITSIVNRL